MRLVILSKSDFSKHIYDLAKESNKYLEIFYLDDYCKDNDVKDFMNDFVLYLNDDTYFFAGFESDERRCEWLNKLMELGANIATIIAQNATIHPTSRVLPGCLIDHNAIIEENCLIKTGCYIEQNVIIKANTIVEKSGMAISNISTH